MQKKLGYSLTALMLSMFLASTEARAGVSSGAGLGDASGLGAAATERGSTGHASPQGYLGVDVRDISDDRVSVLKLKDTHGAEITKVDHDGPAGQMGLRERDVVVQLNGTAIEGQDQMRRLLREMPPGRSITLVISRDGQQMTVNSQMADLNEVERQAWEKHLSGVAFQPAVPQAPATGLPLDEAGAAGAQGASAGPAPTSRYSRSFIGTLLMTPSYTGVLLERMSPQLASFFGVATGSGLLVKTVDDNSPAAMAGLKAGDVVMRANSRNVANMNDWVKTIREAKGRPVNVVVMRDRLEKTFTLTPDGKKRSGLDSPKEGSHSLLAWFAPLF